MHILNECIIWYMRGFLGGTVVENLPANAGDMDLIPVKNMPVLLPGKFQRSLAGYSPWGCKESDLIEHVHVHTHTHTLTRSI